MNSTKEDRGWNLYRRGDGQWVLQYRTDPGKWPETRVPRVHDTERKAERWALAWLEEWRKNAGQRPTLPEPLDEERPTIRILATKWLGLVDDNPKLAPGTRSNYASSMRTHVLPYPVADVPIAELGPSQLRAWVRKIRDDGKTKTRWETGEDGKKIRALTRGGPLSPFACRNATNALTAFFRDVMAEEWVPLPANPMEHEAVRREIPDGVTLAGKHTIIHFTRLVAERLLTAPRVPEWRRVRTLVELTSGMAEGEVAGLRVDDVDVAKDTEIPTYKVTKAIVKAGPDGWATPGKTKTENRVRVLPVHSLAAKALRAWLANGWARHVGRAPKPTDPLFPNDKGEAWRPSMAVMLRADLVRTGLPSTYEGHNYTAHSTRRSFATWLAEADVPEDTRRRLMGHAAGDVTALHYTARSLRSLHEAVERIKLDLSAGEVIALPMRLASGAREPSTTEPQAGTVTAILTAGRGKARGKDDGIRKDSKHRGTNSVGRVPASQAGCRGFESRVPL
jgi:integrase